MVTDCTCISANRKHPDGNGWGRIRSNKHGYSLEVKSLGILLHGISNL